MSSRAWQRKTAQRPFPIHILSNFKYMNHLRVYFKAQPERFFSLQTSKQIALPVMFLSHFYCHTKLITHHVSGTHNANGAAGKSLFRQG